MSNKLSPLFEKEVTRFILNIETLFSRYDIFTHLFYVYNIKVDTDLFAGRLLQKLRRSGRIKFHNVSRRWRVENTGDQDD